MSLHMEEDIESSMVLMGVIQGAHGIKGMVRIHTFTEEAETLKNYSPFYDDEGMLFEIESMKSVSINAVLVQLKGVHSRNDAEKLKGKNLYVPRDVLEDLSDEEYYYVDLIGLKVLGENQEIIGSVQNVQNFGAGDILEIRCLSGQMILLPFRYEFVPMVDLKKRTMTVKDFEIGKSQEIKNA